MKQLLTKELVLNSLNDLPDKFSLDEIMERIYVLHKIEKALEQSAKGKTYSETQARKILSKWLKSDGTKKH